MAQKLDWEAIERDYRAGVKSLRQIADEHGITHGAINKRAKKENWERDLQAKIKAKAEAKVSKAAVSRAVSADTASEKEIVEANAQMQADLVLAHRDDIRRQRALVGKLLEELEAQTGDIGLYEQLGDLLFQPDEKGIDRLNELYRKVTSLPSRVDSAKRLSETLKNLIALEREAFGVDGRRTFGQSLDEFLDGLAAAAG